MILTWSAGGWRALIVGGNANNGSNAGAFTFNGNNAAGNRNRNIGTRHCCLSVVGHLLLLKEANM